VAELIDYLLLVPVTGVVFIIPVVLPTMLVLGAAAAVEV
jgi:hypothetical protein